MKEKSAFEIKLRQRYLHKQYGLWQGRVTRQCTSHDLNSAKYTRTAFVFQDNSFLKEKKSNYI